MRNVPLFRRLINIDVRVFCTWKTKDFVQCLKFTLSEIFSAFARHIKCCLSFLVDYQPAPFLFYESVFFATPSPVVFIQLSESFVTTSHSLKITRERRASTFSHKLDICLIPFTSANIKMSQKIIREIIFSTSSVRRIFISTSVRVLNVSNGVLGETFQRIK